MSQILFSLSFAAGLFLGMLILLEVGRRIGQERQGKAEEGARAGLGAVEGAVFALLGLLIAFTFSSAASRFETRRQLIVQEANAIGTAWLRIDLLSTNMQPAMRDLFRRYLDARLAVYQMLPDLTAARAELNKANALQSEIWRQAAIACLNSPDPLKAQLIAALNDMFDITTTRTMAARAHSPPIIYVMLGTLALMAALLAGFAMGGGKNRSWIHMIGFALIVAATVYVILDLEFPRLGIIRVDAFDQVLVDLRQSMD